MLDERSLALQARDVVVQTLREQEHRHQALQAVIAAVEAENPTVAPERVKAAIVSLLNRGILELTRDGHLKLVRR